MANPFGGVVDDEKLEEMGRYRGKMKRQEDRAREAMALIKEEGKDQKAAQYVQSVKDWYGNGVSCLIRLYNATGDTLYYVTDLDWIGSIGRTPYPTEIGNGQWASFLHVHPTSEPTGSQAAVVYRGKNLDGYHRDYLIAWSVPWGRWYKNKAYSDVGRIDSFQSRWDNVKINLENGGYSHTTDKGGCFIQVDIGMGTSPPFIAILKTRFRP